MKKFSAYLSLAVVGTSAMIIQIILIRELLVVFTGNELSIGLFLTQWLLAQAAGSLLFSRIEIPAKKIGTWFMSAQTGMVISFPVLIYMIRTIKPILGYLPGEEISLITLSGLSMLLVFVPGFFGGGLFNLACRLLTTQHENSIKSIARVYSIEATGSLLGGILVTYLCLEYLQPMESAFGLIMINLLSVLILNRGLQTKNTWFAFREASLYFCITASLIFWINGGVNRLHLLSLEKEWQDYEVLEYHNSIYNNTILLSRAGQTDILLNGIPVAHMPDPDYQATEETAHIPMLMHPHPAEVCLIGTASGGLLNEILKHKMARIDLIEPDQLLLEAVIKKFSPIDRQALENQRVKIHFADGRSFLLSTNKKYDVLLLNLSGPATLEMNRYYTREFFQICHNRLNPGGIVFFRMPSGGSYLSEQIINLNQSILSAASAVFAEKLVIPGEMAMVILGDKLPAADNLAALLAQHLHQRQIQTRLISEPFFRIAMDSSRMAWYNMALTRKNGHINSDLHPSAVLFSLAYWASSHEPVMLKFISRITDANLLFFISMITMSVLLVIIINSRLTHKRDNLIFITVFTTGFSGLGLSVLLALLFQATYGYIYYWLGLLVAAFMTGLAAGAKWYENIDISKVRKPVLLFEAGFILLCAILLGVLESRLYLQILDLFRFIILVLAFATGILVGGEFPLATEIYTRGKQKLAGGAGMIYAADLLGASLAGIIVSIIMIPVIGIPQTIMVIGYLKILSLAAFAIFYPKNKLPA